MIIFKHILVNSIVAIMLMHTAIPHNHYTRTELRHSIDHNQVASIIDVLGLGFHHGSRKDLNESNQVSYQELNLSALELTSFPIINTEIIELDQSSVTLDYTHLCIKHYKYFYSNNLPLRAPPKQII